MVSEGRQSIIMEEAGWEELVHYTVTEQKDQGWIRLLKDQSLMTFFLFLFIETRTHTAQAGLILLM